MAEVPIDLNAHLRREPNESYNDHRRDLGYSYHRCRQPRFTMVARSGPRQRSQCRQTRSRSASALISASRCRPERPQPALDGGLMRSQTPPRDIPGAGVPPIHTANNADDRIRVPSGQGWKGRLIHRSLHEGRSLRHRTQIRQCFLRAIFNNVDIHDNGPRLPLPRRQNLGRNPTRSRLLDHQSGNVRERLDRFGDARLICLGGST